MFLAKVRRFAVCSAVLTGLVAVPNLFAADDESVASDQLLPPGVLLHVRISDVSDLKERLPETGFGKIYQDESMEKIRAKVEEAFEKGSEEAGKELGFPLSDLLNLPEGEVSLSLIQPAGRTLAGVLIMEIGDQKETLDKALEKLDEAITKQGATKKTETIEEVEVTVYEMDKPGSDSVKNTFCFFTEDGKFVGGSDIAVLQDVLSRWDGDSDDVLAEQEVYSYIREKCATRSDDDSSVIEYYIDPMGLLMAGLNSSEELSTQALMVSAYLPTLGLDKLKALGGNLDIAEGDFDVHSKSFIYVDQPTSGLLRAFEFPATDLAPPAWVGAGTPAYNAMNWDAAGAYDALTEMADTFLGQPGAAAQQVTQMSTQLGFHLKDDLIDHLAGPIVMLSDVNPEATQVGQKFLAAVKLKDSAAFQETLNVLLQKAGSQVSERDFEGVKIYDIQAPNEEIHPAIAIAKDNLFVTSHADMLEAALRSSDDSLAESEGYKKIAKLMPSQCSIVSFSDLRKQMKPTYDMLKSGKLDGAFEGQVDFSDFPEFEKIEKYFSISGSFTIPDEKGVYSEGFMLGGE